MDNDQKEETVAHYIARNLIESHKEDALAQKIERDSKKRKPKSKG